MASGPIRVLAYKFQSKGKTLLYTGDNEPYYDVLADRTGAGQTGIHRRSEFIDECNQRVVDFCSGADVVIADAQYTDEEYKSKRGWGHSSIGQVLTLAQESGVKKLVLFHHEPTHDDRTLDRILQDAQKRVRKAKQKTRVIMAKEGLLLSV